MRGWRRALWRGQGRNVRREGAGHRRGLRLEWCSRLRLAIGCQLGFRHRQAVLFRQVNRGRSGRRRRHDRQRARLPLGCGHDERWPGTRRGGKPLYAGYRLWRSGGPGTRPPRPGQRWLRLLHMGSPGRSDEVPDHADRGGSTLSVNQRAQELRILPGGQRALEPSAVAEQARLQHGSWHGGRGRPLGPRCRSREVRTGVTLVRGVRAGRPVDDLRRALADHPLPQPHCSPPRRLVQAADLLDEALPIGMLKVKDRVQRPVHVVGDVRDLRHEPVGRVRHDSPRRPPATSTANSCWHCGQVTAARVWPSALIRR